ncbi:MAG: insulinase family protein [Myxococcaceae bacterium]|nr:insulinase family protein [Myxococcaceae bacterium]
MARSAPSSAKKPERIFPYELKVSTLPNGLTVVRVPFHSPGLVAYYSVARVGSRNEVEPKHTGFAHFFEHMMFKGTAAHPEGSREKILAKGGFDDNAYTTDDFTTYHSYGPSSALKELVEVEADRFKNLSYSEPSFQTEAKAVLGEYHKNAARPELKLEETLLSTAFTKHTYQHTTLGFYDDIKAMPGYYEYSKEFFRRWYTPDNVVLVIVGDFDDAQLMGWIAKNYGDWKGHKADVKIPAEPSQGELCAATLPWEGPALPRLMLAWHTPAARLDTRDAAIQEVLAAYLVGPTSELHKELVLDRQLLESITSWYYPHRDPNLFTIDATLKDEKNREAALDRINKAIRDLVSNRVDGKRVEAIKSNARYGILMNLESPDDVAGQLAQFIGVYGDPMALEKHLQNIAMVKPQDLVQFARRYFIARNRTEISLVPVAAKKDGAAKEDAAKEGGAQ